MRLDACNLLERLFEINRRGRTSREAHGLANADHHPQRDLGRKTGVGGHELEQPRAEPLQVLESGFTGVRGHRTRPEGPLPATCCIFARPPAFAPITPAEGREPSAVSPAPAVAFSIAAAHNSSACAFSARKSRRS